MIDDVEPFESVVGEPPPRWAHNLPRPSCTYDHSEFWRVLRSVPIGSDNIDRTALLARRIASDGFETHVRPRDLIDVLRTWNARNLEPLSEGELWAIVREERARTQSTVTRCP